MDIKQHPIYKCKVIHCDTVKDIFLELPKTNLLSSYEWQAIANFFEPCKPNSSDDFDKIKLIFNKLISESQKEFLDGHCIDYEDICDGANSLKDIRENYSSDVCYETEKIMLYVNKTLGLKLFSGIN